MTGKQANKYATNIDMCLNEILRFVVDKVETLPPKFDAGRMVYLIGDYKEGETEYTGKSIYVCDGEKWHLILSDIQIPIFEKAIEELWKAKVDKNCDTELGKSRVCNMPEDKGAALKFEHNDKSMSAVSVHNGGLTGLGAEIYSVDADKKGSRLLVTKDGIFYTKGKADSTFGEKDELITVMTKDELQRQIDDLYVKKTDRLCTTAAGKSYISNLEGDHGAVMKYEHVDGRWSGIAVDDGSSNIDAEIYSVDNAKIGARLIIAGKGNDKKIYYTKGKSDMSFGAEHELATAGAVGNGQITVVYKDKGGQIIPWSFTVNQNNPAKLDLSHLGEGGEVPGKGTITLANEDGTWSKSFNVNQPNDQTITLPTGGGGGERIDAYSQVFGNLVDREYNIKHSLQSMDVICNIKKTNPTEDGCEFVDAQIFVVSSNEIKIRLTNVPTEANEFTVTVFAHKMVNNMSNGGTAIRFGNTADTDYTITHGLGTQIFTYAIRKTNATAEGYEFVSAKVFVIDDNTVRVKLNNPAEIENEFTLVIISKTV